LSQPKKIPQPLKNKCGATSLGLERLAEARRGSFLLFSLLTNACVPWHFRNEYSQPAPVRCSGED